MEVEWHPDCMSDFPLSIQEGLRRYVEQGIPTGDGLRRVLMNEAFADTICGLDPKAAAFAQDIVRFLYNHAPGGCWGSRERVEAWIKRGGIQGR